MNMTGLSLSLAMKLGLRNIITARVCGGYVEVTLLTWDQYCSIVVKMYLKP